MDKRWGGMAVAVLGMALAAQGQFISKAGASNSTAAAKDPVHYLFPEQVELPSGKATTVELHFRIAPGLHVNSHHPSDEFLIPTTFTIPDGAGVKLASAEYPAGTNMRLPAEPTTPLNVYTGDFAIATRMVASRGNHLVQGKLRFQACDEMQCMPPKTINVAIDIIGK